MKDRKGAGLMDIIKIGLIVFLIYAAYVVFVLKEPFPFFGKEKTDTTNSNPSNNAVNNNNQNTAAASNNSNSTVVEGAVAVYNFEADYIDVGQGDSILIRYPSGKYMLVDAGTRYKGNLISDYLKKKGVEKIDTVVATHNDADHIGGFVKILREFNVSRFLYVNTTCDTLTCEEVLRIAKDEVAEVINTNTGITYYMDNLTTTRILNPPPQLIGGGKDTNTNSIVFKITYNEKSFLFTGDCDFACENEMISRQKNLAANILKVAHHGSNGATSKEFLDLVAPDYAIISVAKSNQYGLPGKDLITRLINVKVLRTDELGTVVVETDGSKIEVKNNG